MAARGYGDIPEIGRHIETPQRATQGADVRQVRAGPVPLTPGGVAR